MRAAIGTARVLPTRGVPHERKTGVTRAELITARLVQDERGWLRVADS